MRQWTDTVFTIILCVNLLWTIAWTFYPASQPSRLTTDGREICNLIAIFGFAIYIKMRSSDDQTDR